MFTPGQRALAVADGESRNGVWLAKALKLTEHDDGINEGAGHCGMSALIDLVVRK